MQQKICLVTGATGFLGRQVIRALNEKDISVRAMVRDPAKADCIKQYEPEIVVGDMLSRRDLDKAIKNVQYVVHTAACMDGDLTLCVDITARGTERILQACLKNNVKHFIHISSLSVYQVAGLPAKTFISENSELERKPSERGAYSYTKLAADYIAQKYIQVYKLPITILRPGLLIGYGGQSFFGNIGITLKNFYLIFGKGQNILPLVSVKDVAFVIAGILDNQKVKGRVFNLVDPALINQNEYMKKYSETKNGTMWYLHVPLSILFAFARVNMFLNKITLGKLPNIMTPYRLSSATSDIVFDGKQIMQILTKPYPFGINRALKDLFTQNNQL